jgi:hypothetical protein
MLSIRHANNGTGFRVKQILKCPPPLAQVAKSKMGRLNSGQPFHPGQTLESPNCLQLVQLAGKALEKTPDAGLKKVSQRPCRGPES